MMNHLFFGDNLDLMRRYIEDESVELIHFDISFNSNVNYNVLFAEQDGDKGRTPLRLSSLAISEQSKKKKKIFNDAPGSSRGFLFARKPVRSPSPEHPCRHPRPSHL